MIIKVLIENTAISDDFQTEHGLSLYIETGGYKILFDTGASNLFTENAEKLNVDLEEIDFVVISHGHHDHGGGLKLFLERNKKARVFVHEKAFEEHYARRPDGGLETIGLDEVLKHDKRLVFTGDRLVIADGIELFSNVRERELFSPANRVILMKRGGDTTEDTFEHEQNLIIEENGRMMLFAGCAHSGIANIARFFTALKGRPADYAFGGFHLYNPNAKKSEPPEFVTQIGDFLKSTPTKYYTGHCTGIEAYRLLKDMLGDQLQYLATGSVINI